jgi:hypothetical protein
MKRTDKIIDDSPIHLRRFVDEGNTVYLVSCVSEKHAVPTPAKDLYTSTWFKKARSFVERTGCTWFILSAEHGLVSPEQVVSPYEKTLNRMPIDERRRWAQRVFAQLEEAAPRMERAIFLAGQRYREFLVDHFRSRSILVEVAMQGLQDRRAA